jgi:twinkle protein
MEEQEKLTRLKGVYEPIHLADRVQNDYVHGLVPGTSTGLHALDLNYSVKRRQWTVVTGIPGHGKSTFIDNVMVRMARQSG